MANSFFQALTYHPDPRYQRWIKRSWLLLLGGIGSVFLLFIILSLTRLPPIEHLENPKSEVASEIFYDNGESMGRFFRQNRVPVNYNQLSPNLVKALIATEDQRYSKHAGIDYRGTVRSIVKTGILGQSSAGGGSTISQQLAKLLFTERRATSKWQRGFQKLQEWIIAVQLERRYTKEEIIALYLNKFNFINQAYGIKAASEIYFNKTPDKLQLHEAATLIGMLKNPSLYNPLRFPERTLKRREVVLDQMKKNGYITTQTYDVTRKLPMGLQFTPQNHIEGNANYFRSEVAKYVTNIIKKNNLRNNQGELLDIWEDGLKIYSTIDPQMQELAEKTMTEHMAKLQKTFFSHWRGKDPWAYHSGGEKEISIEYRQNSLKKIIRETDRYQRLRSEILLPALEALKEQAGDDITFSEDDREIERMVNESDKPGVIRKLVADKMISEKLAGTYRTTMSAPLFTSTKTAWKKLQTAVDKEFTTPVKMTVFAYNKNMNADTTMSPLDSIKYHRMILQTGIMAVEPRNGLVKVWVGGVNFDYFKYDHVTINRQVGSTFKPFIYSAAIALQGLSPCFTVSDRAYTIRPGDGQFGLIESWTPKNATGRYTGASYQLRDALKNSVNTVSVYLMKQMGSVEPVMELIRQMGMDTEQRLPNGNYRIPHQPSICLGAVDLSVLEMTGAYTAFANNGIYNKPMFITRIEDKNGKVIYTEMPDEKTALPPDANYVMIEMLKHAGKLEDATETEIGGKSGTTNDYVDGWFMGVTPSLVVGTWVGGEDKWVRFRNLALGQGSYMAKPFFREFIKKLEKSNISSFDASRTFFKPVSISIELNCGAYARADEFRASDNPFDDGMFDEGGDNSFGDEPVEDFN